MFLLAINTSGILVIEIIIAAIEIIGASLLVAILFIMILPMKKGNQKVAPSPKKVVKSNSDKKATDSDGNSDEEEDDDDEDDSDDDDSDDDDDEDDDEEDEDGDDDEDEDDE